MRSFKQRPEIKRFDGEKRKPLNLGYQGGKEGGSQMLGKLHHVCIAVKDMQQALATYKVLLELEEDEIYVSDEWEDGTVGDKMIFAYLQKDGTILELIQPLKPGGNMDKFLQEKGEGLHHISFESSNIVRDFERVKSLGFRVIGDQLAEDVFGVKFQFIHPASAHGALVEMVQAHKTEGEQCIPIPPE